MRIAVLGAGPGGAAAALTLARGGADVTVHLPAAQTEKPCGGALPAYLLEELDGPPLAAAPAVEVRLARLENAAGGSLEVPLDGLRVYRRRDLDGALLAAAEAAGAKRREGRIRRLELGGGVTLHDVGGARTYDWLVAADGALSAARRRLGLSPAAASIGLGASVPLPPDAGPGGIVLGFPDVGDAYLWIFPRPGGVSVGIAYGADRLSDGAARACLDAFVDRHLPGSGAGGSRYRYPIPVFGPQTGTALRRAAERRVLLVGDAAGLADPLTREGIRPAMRAGRWAAQSLLDGRPEDYPRRVVSGLAADMARAERAGGLFYEDRIGQWMVPVCRALPGVRRVLGDLLTCRQPYRGLRRRLLGAAVGRPSAAARAPGAGAGQA